MEKTEILVICRHPEILATIVRLINNRPEWNATGCETDEQAIDAFKNINYKLVLIGAGVAPLSELHLRQAFTAQNPQAKIVQHFGGGSGLLFAEIYGALDAK
jgi:DNA-binding NarL/FixJ family response regulator